MKNVLSTKDFFTYCRLHKQANFRHDTKNGKSMRINNAIIPFKINGVKLNCYGGKGPNFSMCEFNSNILNSSLDSFVYDGCTFNETRIEQTRLWYNVFHKCNFIKCQFNKVSMSKNQFIDCDFEDCNFNDCDLAYSLMNINIYTYDVPIVFSATKIGGSCTIACSIHEADKFMPGRWLYQRSVICENIFGIIPLRSVKIEGPNKEGMAWMRYNEDTCPIPDDKLNDIKSILDIYNNIGISKNMFITDFIRKIDVNKIGTLFENNTTTNTSGGNNE